VSPGDRTRERIKRANEQRQARRREIVKFLVLAVEIHGPDQDWPELRRMVTVFGHHAQIEEAEVDAVADMTIRQLFGYHFG
jgi:hypothetical protein